MTDIKEQDLELCAVPRWQQYKSQLTNLAFDKFVRQAQNDPSAVLLDVRTALEFEMETIPNAINFNYLSPTLADEIESLDRRKHYYIFCRTGRRSLRVCMLLKNIGMTVYNLDTGLRNTVIPC